MATYGHSGGYGMNDDQRGGHHPKAVERIVELKTELREAKLREAATGFLAAWDNGSRCGSVLPWIERLRAALESKGGES